MNEDELDFNPEEYENELKPGVVRLGEDPTVDTVMEAAEKRLSNPIRLRIFADECRKRPEGETYMQRQRRLNQAREKLFANA
jgi:hypothetical protein